MGRLICGVAKNDSETVLDSEGKVKRSYNVWINMIHRCYNKNRNGYKNYGAKGVTVCEEWLLFSNFERWYDENYVEGCQVDKDLSGLNEYSPAGCRFISAKENTIDANKRRDYSKLKLRTGEKNPYAKQIEYYSNTPTLRRTFMSVCRSRNVNFNDFDEIFSEWHIKPKGDRERKFIYVTKKKK